MARAIGAAVARFPDTEEVIGSIPVSPTSITAGQRYFSTAATPPQATVPPRRLLRRPRRCGKPSTPPRNLSTTAKQFSESTVGSRSVTSRSPSPNTLTGSTTGAYTTKSATSHPASSRPNIQQPPTLGTTLRHRSSPGPDPNNRPSTRHGRFKPSRTTFSWRATNVVVAK